MKFLKKIFGIGSSTEDLSMEEKISRAEKEYSGFALVSKVLEIEGIKDTDSRFWYRLVDLCAKYEVNFVIPCSEGGPC